MGIVSTLVDDILLALNGRQDLDVAILGECVFHTPWQTGDNAKDLEIFRRIGGFKRTETIDLFGNPSIKFDLHDDLPEKYSGQFDVVIDAGTLFCCFDVAKAWRNAIALLKPKADIFHTAGLTGYFGRSYYSFHPMLFRDFYSTNGFEFDMKVQVRNTFAQHGLLRRASNKLWPHDTNPKPISANHIYATAGSWRGISFDVPGGKEAMQLPNDAEIYCHAKREDSKPFKNAIPGYYAK